jgi:hypothetical protein
MERIDSADKYIASSLAILLAKILPVNSLS